MWNLNEQKKLNQRAKNLKEISQKLIQKIEEENINLGNYEEKEKEKENTENFELAIKLRELCGKYNEIFFENEKEIQLHFKKEKEKEKIINQNLEISSQKLEEINNLILLEKKNQIQTQIAIMEKIVEKKENEEHEYLNEVIDLFQNTKLSLIQEELEIEQNKQNNKESLANLSKEIQKELQNGSFYDENYEEVLTLNSILKRKLKKETQKKENRKKKIEKNDLKSKIAQLKEDNGTLLSNLFEFLDQFYPKQTKKEIEKKEKKKKLTKRTKKSKKSKKKESDSNSNSDSNSDSDSDIVIDIDGIDQDFFSLKQIIQQLLNQAKSPNKFIKINNQFWKPYIELLERSNIIVFHPEDKKQIKLSFDF
ncbi:centromere protein k [Anaeramoeba ignava]|uniref:Centromere protein k n=1 Tax=Anaeramoeba ignava TaxID=1746090 RepID=A0A9Q0L6W9_ANAIG|nr:centromere protein k [Anaeramoeba ignava]